MYSLRRVLAVRFALTMFIALSLIAVWAMFGVKRTLRIQIDRALAGLLEVRQAGLAAGTPLPPQPSGADFLHSFEDGSQTALVRNADGEITQSTARIPADFPLDTAAFLAARSGRVTWSTVSWRDGSVRVLYAPAPTGSPNGSTVIEVAASLKPLAGANQNLLLALLGTVVLGTLAVGFGAFWLAGSAVAPVLEVASQAGAIHPELPHKRITAHTDIAEYESLVAVLNDLLDRCGRAFAAQRRLTADLGHELRTPLTALRGEMEIALRSQRTPLDYQRVLRSGLEEIDRLTTMCDDLLLITRLNSRTTPLHRGPTDAQEVILDSLARVRRNIEDRALSVTTSFNYAGEPVLLDARLLSQLVDELLENAVKFSPIRGSISLGTEEYRGGLRLWIEDSGPGIPSDKMEHLFEPFFRADEARPRAEGTGLGLNLAATIARAHGGTIRGTNVPNHGARFEVDLPAESARVNGRSAVTA